MRSIRLFPAALIICLLALAFGTTSAGAAPGAYRIVIVQANCEPPTKFQAQLQAFPDVAVVDIVPACLSTPTLGQLTPYDMVVSMNEDEYADPVAYGNLLADYVDSGGFVFQYAYDNEEGLQPFGRFLTGGYAPFIAGDNPNDSATLGEFDASSPLMQGVTALASDDNTEPALAPGATLVAKWSDGRNLVAYKGRVASASAYVGDEAEWSGDFGRLTINALRFLGAHTLTVSNPSGGGFVLSNVGGIVCGSVCSTVLPNGTPVTLATAGGVRGFAFAGFSGACTGPTCSLTLDADKTVTANFVSFRFGKRVARNREKGTATLTVNAGGPGKLTLSGKGVKRRSKTIPAARKVKLLIKAKGKTAKALRENGKAKVKIGVTYTPTAGLPARAEKSVTLRLNG
ncbi:MAG TPA: hypothetical protein VGK41_10155 [Solirubrobacterales bacterium]